MGLVSYICWGSHTFFDPTPSRIGGRLVAMSPMRRVAGAADRALTAQQPETTYFGG